MSDSTKVILALYCAMVVILALCCFIQDHIPKRPRTAKGTAAPQIGPSGEYSGTSTLDRFGQNKAPNNDWELHESRCK